MKSIKPIPPAAARFAGCASLPLQAPARTKARPVRHGKLWPGENFAGWTHEWNLAGALLDKTFILPALAGAHGPQTF